MKKMFSMLVLALSLSLSVNAQHATVAPHVTVTPHVTVAPHVTATPHVSAPVHISEPAHVAPAVHTSEPVTVSKPATSKVTPVNETESSLVKPGTVIPHAIVHNTSDTTKGKTDSTKANSGTEVKQLDAQPTPVNKDDEGLPWGFIGIFAFIMGLVLYVTFRDSDDENPKVSAEPGTTESPTEVDAEPVSKDVTPKGNSSK